MGFTTEKIPYPLNFGIDLSPYEISSHPSDDIFPDLVSKLEELKIDFMIHNVSNKDPKLRKDIFENNNAISTTNTTLTPIFLNDYSLFSHEWKSKFIGKVHNEDVENLIQNAELVNMDLEYCNHISTNFILSKLPSSYVSSTESSLNMKDNLSPLRIDEKNTNNFLFTKVLKKFLTDNPDKLVNISVDFSKAGLDSWNRLQSALGSVENLGLILEIQPDLPDESVLCEFVAHNLKAISLPISIFVTNKNGYPVLSKVHQEYIKYLFGFKIDVIFTDDSNLLVSKNISGVSSSSYNLTNFAKIKDYYLYLCHLFTNHREFKNIDYTLFYYLDTFQIPLQPLRDNLQSQTYECFEEDNMKYDYYEAAVDLALKNFISKGCLNKQKMQVDTEMKGSNMISEYSGDRTLTACVLGAGRGPLVRKVVQAAIKNNFKIGENFKVFCVEKNRNAFNTLLYLKIKEPEVFGNVEMHFSDMRDFKPENKIDIVVSELLGSFGDNELSPECLLNIQKYLSTDSIMIPHSYTSYIRPVTCPVIWSNIKKIKDNYQSSYVILLHKAYYPIKEVSECFTFTHPVHQADFNRHRQLNFSFEKNSVIHGFVGYFKTVLYDTVEISIIPFDHTPNLFSWFPIYFPSINPIEIFSNEHLIINITRENDGKKVWYEWNFETMSISSTKRLECTSNTIHNLGGVHSSIML